MATIATPKLLTSMPTITSGLPELRMSGGRVRCSAGTSKTGIAASVASASSVMSVGISPVLALVDERMSTEGTGLSLGISNNLLAWILIGVFGIIWALFFIYTGTLEEDEDSGLSL